MLQLRKVLDWLLGSADFINQYKHTCMRQIVLHSASNAIDQICWCVCVCVCFGCYSATTPHMEDRMHSICISAYNVYWMPCEKEINAIILPYIGCLKPEQSARGFVEFFISLAWRWMICKYYMGVENRNECVCVYQRMRKKQQLFPCAVFIHLQQKRRETSCSTFFINFITLF